jgi:polyisoprenyl-teichoic acid--peptidoglycan teichoic acid transferase
VEETLWPGISSAPAGARAAPAADRTVPRAGWPLAMAVASFLFVVFIGGGLLVGALGLRTLSLQHAAIVPMPAPVREALDSIAGVARPGSPEVRLSALFAALPDWDGTEPFNILLLGIDQRDDEREVGTDPGRTDTMMLLRIDPRAKSAGLISFPRDLWVDIPTVGPGRINSAFTYGEVRQRAGGGPALAKRTVEQNFGLRVDYYALVNFHGLEQIVDTVGGIVVDVERPLKDNEYPTDDYGIERVYIPPGLQFMDGRMALKYARSRHSDNDFGRMRRQQRVLFALRQRAAQARDLLTTDLDVGQLVRLAKLAQQVDPSRIRTMVIDGSMVREANPRAGQYELLWDKDRIRRALAALIADLSPEQATRIEVLNGTARPGAAADAAKLLLSLGYDVTRIDDADRDNYAESVLEVAADRQSLADDLATTLRLSRWSTRVPRGGDDVDVRLIVGRDFRLPEPAATPAGAGTSPAPGGPAGLRGE